MIIVTTDAIPGATIVETLGLVRGSTVRTRHIGRDIMAGIRNIVGGEVSEYTKLLADAREESLQRMIENVEAMGGNAVVGTRFITAAVAQGAAEFSVFQSTQEGAILLGGRFGCNWSGIGDNR